MRRLLFIILGLWAIGYGLWAQELIRETIVIGDVYDAYTGKALTNVHIYFQGTELGTTTTPEGMFLLRGQLDKKRVMVVSAVGYHTERVPIEAGQQVGVQIALKEKIANLSEVFVTPGANPALALMNNVRKHRPNNEYAVDMQQAHTQTALYVSDIQSKHLQRNLWKSLQAGMLQSEDSTYLIPLYWRKQAGDEVEEQATLLTLTDYQLLLNQMQSTCNFYDNHINILSASLLSPLATSGSTYYNYFLVDSLTVGKEKHYLVHFRTKNEFYATFDGEMTIDSATYALRSIQASVPVQSNINYLRQLTVRQTFDANNQLRSEDMSLLLDFAIKADTSRIFPTLFLTRNTQLPTNINPLPIANSQSPIANNQSSIAQAMDSVSNTPLFRTAKFFAKVFQTGYIPFNQPIEMGKINELLKINNVEGFRIAIPLRTTEKLWKNLSLGGYFAYGTKDRAWKGMGELNINLPTQRRHTMQFKYEDRYVYSDVDDFQENLRENSIFNARVNLITEIMRGAPWNKEYYYNTSIRRREGRLHFRDDWNKYLETQTYFKIGRMGYGLPTTDYRAQPSFFYYTLGTSARISFNERKVDLYFQRKYIYNHLPVIYIGAELGSYRTPLLPSYRMYANLQFLMRHNVNLGLAGKLEYILQAGMIFGEVPYPLLHIFSGNQTYVFDTQRFTTMNTYQYAADQYVSLQALWDGKGVLFNLIPGLRYARLHELLELKIAYGKMRNDHSSIVPFPSAPTELASATYTPLTSMKVPYVEVGVGIGNILRVGEVYGVFRLTNMHDPYSPWWALRFRISMGL